MKIIRSVSGNLLSLKNFLVGNFIQKYLKDWLKKDWNRNGALLTMESCLKQQFMSGELRLRNSRKKVIRKFFSNKSQIISKYMNPENKADRRSMQFRFASFYPASPVLPGIIFIALGTGKSNKKVKTIQLQTRANTVRD